MAQLEVRTGSKFDANDLRVGGDAVWIDYNFGVGALTRGSAAPELITIGTTSIETLAFDGVNTLEQVSTVLEVNHNWKEGTNLSPHLHWYPTTAAAGSVKWFLEYAWTKTGGVVPASTTITVITPTTEVAWHTIFSGFPEIDGTGYLIGSQLHIRLYRDPTDEDDDYGADAALATFGIHAEIDTLGSREITVK